MSNKYYLGIDGGGTKTELLLRDQNGKDIKRLIVGPSNPNDIGMEKSQLVLQDAVVKITENVNCDSISAFAGIAGALTGNNKLELEKLFSKFGFNKFAVGSDVENIISLGLDDKDGIAVIMGTGVGTFKVINGKSQKVASLGYLLEDGGSGYCIGRDGIKAYFNQQDGLGQPTLITKEIEKRSDYDKENFLSNVYKGGKKYVASFSEQVFNALRDGDKVAKNIVEKNVLTVVELVSKIASTMKKPIKMVFAGGITNDKYVVNCLLNSFNEQYAMEFLTNTPMVEGAIKLAQKL